MAKAVVFFAEGTEECEALLVVDLLRRAKVEVLVASASGSREILSSHKVHITADALAEEVDYSDVDLVVLPGGIPGTPNLAANKTVTDTCAAFAKNTTAFAIRITSHIKYQKEKPRAAALGNALLAVRGLCVSHRTFFQLPAAHAVHCRLRSAPG